MKDKLKQDIFNQDAVKPDGVDDHQIRSAVGSVKSGVPEDLDNRVTAMLNAELNDEKEKRKKRLKRFRIFDRPVLLYPAAAAIMVMIAAAVFMFQPPNPTDTIEPAPLTEIKTEIELTDANIKILWVQKKDFKLN